MIIPKYRNYKFEEGDIIISLTLIEFEYMIITPYHEFTITKIEKKKNEYKKYYLIDNDGVVITHSPSGCIENDFTLKVELDCAKKRNNELNDDYKIYKFIKDNCPHKCDSWSDYSSYYRCKMKNIHDDDSCGVGLECINHIDNKIIQKDNFVLKYIRKRKIKKLNENTEI